MAVDLGRGQAPLYPVNKRENYRIHVSCKEWGEETLYAARKGHVLLYPARKKTGTQGQSPEGWGGNPIACKEGGQESLYPVRKHRIGIPCIM
jgi:hypothetical protein